MSPEQDNEEAAEDNEFSPEFRESYTRTRDMLNELCRGRDSAIAAMEAALDYVRRNRVEDPESGILLVCTQEWQALDKCIEAARQWATASIVAPDQ